MGGKENTRKKKSGVGGGESQMQKKQHGKFIGEVNESPAAHGLVEMGQFKL